MSTEDARRNLPDLVLLGDPPVSNNEYQKPQQINPSHLNQGSTPQIGEQASTTKRHEKDCVFVSPSAWGKYDIANPSFLSHLIAQKRLIESDIQDTERTFSISQILLHPSAVMSTDRCLWVKEEGKHLSATAGIGDIIAITSFHSTSDSTFTDLLRQAGWAFVVQYVLLSFAYSI